MWSQALVQEFNPTRFLISTSAPAWRRRRTISWRPQPEAVISAVESFYHGILLFSRGNEIRLRLRERERGGYTGKATRNCSSLHTSTAAARVRRTAINVIWCQWQRVRMSEQNIRTQIKMWCDGRTDRHFSLVGTLWSCRHRTSNYVDLFTTVLSVLYTIQYFALRLWSLALAWRFI